jgi:hypothetical protein
MMRGAKKRPESIEQRWGKAVGTEVERSWSVFPN